MGSTCSNKSAILAENPEYQILKSKSIHHRDEQLRIRRSLLYNASGSETTFVDLTTPRSGVSIKWKRGELIGQGAYAQVFQCMNIKTGELLAVKHFTVISK